MLLAAGGRYVSVALQVEGGQGFFVSHVSVTYEERVLVEI